jgi:energy-coupling factor transporter transmembrane protein EcfT
MLMLERYAYANRWRWVSPSAKGLFTLCGFMAVFVAGSPRVAGGLALVLVLVTLAGTGISLGSYLRVAAPSLFFLATSAVTLLFSLRPEAVQTLLEACTRIKVKRLFASGSETLPFLSVCRRKVPRNLYGLNPAVAETAV